MNKKQLGQTIDDMQITTIQNESIRIPNSDGLIHLQFRRFAGCPVCNLHLRSFVSAHSELEKLGIREVVVFHSSQKSLIAHQGERPFSVIADPTRKLYREFGVETSLMSLLNPKSWPAMMKGMFHHMGLPGWGETVNGLPADFLIDRKGRLLALKYGRYADDHWSVEELLALVSSAIK